MKYFSLIVFFFLSFSSATAATVYFESQDTSAGIGSPFVVAVNLDAEDSVNALSLVMRIPPSLRPIDVSDGNSIIPFWIEEPIFDEAARTLSFSGIVPNGYQGISGRVLTITFMPEREDAGAVLSFLEGTGAYTGPGNVAPLVAEELVLPIVSGKVNIADAPLDRDAPEEFVPEIVSDPLLMEGKLVVVFSTTDKGSGIERYEVRESWFRMGWYRTWVAAESPYVLRDQNRSSWIEIRAIDAQGNERMVSIPPERLPYEPFAGALLIIIMMLIFWYVSRTR